MGEERKVTVDLREVVKKTRNGSESVKNLLNEIIHLVKRGELKDLDASSLKSKLLEGVSIEIVISDDSE